MLKNFTMSDHHKIYLESFNEILGREIRIFKIKNNIATKELAEALDITAAHLKLIEDGKSNITYVNLIKIAFFCLICP